MLPPHAIGLLSADLLAAAATAGRGDGGLPLARAVAGRVGSIRLTGVPGSASPLNVSGACARSACARGDGSPSTAGRAEIRVA